MFISMLKQAFQMNRNPLPWPKAINAGICSSLPIMIGVIAGNLSYGLLAGIGSFTFLYVANIPYVQRAKKLFLVAITMSLSVGLGTLLAPHPLATAIVVGIIGFAATFVFGALQIKGPASIFFLLGFTMATGMPIDPSFAPLRAGLVLAGGAFAWLLGMAGWLLDPHGPETNAVQKVYRELAVLIQAAGTDRWVEVRQKLVNTLRSAEETLIAGKNPWGSGEHFRRLILLNDQANAIFVYLLEHFEGRKVKLPLDLAAIVQAISDSLPEKKKQELLIWDSHFDGNEVVQTLIDKVNEAIAILNEPFVVVNREGDFSRSSLFRVFGGAFDKNSIVFLSAARFGVVLMIADLVAYSFEFNRSYWITLSCAAVMSGSTIIATFHRALQRSLGTIVGIMIAAIVLSARPEGFVIAIIVFFLTALTELSIVVNYGIAAFFITPNALLLAESTSHFYDLAFFASTRVIDVIIGCGIGLIGTALIGRRKASSLLPHFIAKTIRSQQQYLFTLFSEHRNGIDVIESSERRKMQTNITNLKLVYETAIGEIPRNKVALEMMWPVIFSIVQIGYLLEACLKATNCPILSDETLSQLLLVFETMAKSAEQNGVIPMKLVPEIQGFSKLQKEIADLQDTLQLAKRALS
ncbi:FUSC family protein [Brevibacillus reuszeri]|uniref:FUSC family protein n=1 Tax=Brevibacillus reuszeri TaxID=54915 RepID=UPI003D23BB2C